MRILKRITIVLVINILAILLKERLFPEVHVAFVYNLYWYIVGAVTMMFPIFAERTR